MSSALNKKTVEDIQVSGKRVLVRCDFNVPLKDGVITRLCPDRALAISELDEELISRMLTDSYQGLRKKHGVDE